MVQDLSFGAYVPETDPVERGREILAQANIDHAEFLNSEPIKKLFNGRKPEVRQIHLHLHTPKGSLLDGFARIDELMPLTERYGMPAVGVSDHGTMASHFDFYNAAKKAGLKPILGMEAYVTPNHSWKKADYNQTFYEMDPTNPELPLIHRLSAQEMKDQGFTNVIEIKDKEMLKKATVAVEKLLEIEARALAEQTGERLTATKLKKEITRLKTANTRAGNRFCVREKTHIRDLFEKRPYMNNHLLLIAKNKEGYRNMLKLCSMGFLEGFYFKPRVDYNQLRQYGRGIIATSACLGSDINQCLLNGLDQAAENLIKFYTGIFDEFYLELQPSELPEQHYVNRKLKEFSEKLDVPLIVTTDVHMLTHEEKPIHAAITTIGKSEDTSDISVYDSCYFMSTEEILGKGIPVEAVLNTMKVAAQCEVELDDADIKYPEFEVPEGYDFDSYLQNLASEALFRLSMTKDIDTEKYIERLNYELKVIKDKNISAYFLIVWDYINFARKNGILVGPGRGSAAGSLVSYLLRITNLDPIKYGLLFSRFINPERPGFPDVDTDFDYERRHEVIDYVIQKYGSERVSQIGTYGMLKTKSVLKDIGRGMGVDHNIINEINKFVPFFQGNSPSVEECIETVPEIAAFAEEHPELFEMAIKIQGMPRTSSTHACGILISPTDISQEIPLMRGKEGEAVSQYDGPTLEENGFIKFDFLGLKNLSVINVARQLILERHGIDIDPDELEPEDPEVFRTIQKGYTQGIFQLESTGMTKVFTGLEYVDFDSLIAGVSLYRPGPMQHIPEYQERANGFKDIEYFHDDAKDILESTFGIMIYQEQLMELSGVFAGYSPGAQDSLRKATGKKSQKVMNEVLPKLAQDVISKGYTTSTSEELVRLIEPFVGWNRPFAS